MKENKKQMPTENKTLRQLVLDLVKADFGYEHHKECQDFIHELLTKSKKEERKIGHCEGLTFADLDEIASHVALETLCLLAEPEYLDHELELYAQNDDEDSLMHKKSFRDYVMENFLQAKTHPYKRKGAIA